MGNLFASFPEIPWYVGLGLVVTLVGLWVSIRNYRLASRKARAEHYAAGLRPNVSLVVYSARISGTGNYEPPRHFILACHLAVGRCLDLPFVVEIQNLGQRTASDIGLYLRYPRRLRQWTGGHYEGYASAIVTTEGEWEIVHIDLGDLNPGETGRVLDHFSITRAVFQDAGDATTFPVEFRLVQHDDVAVEGSISFGLIDVSQTSPTDALSSLSQLLPVGDSPKPKYLRDRLIEGLARIADQTRLADQIMIVGRSVVKVSYDKSLTRAEQRHPLDRVPPEALMAQAGVQDRRGYLWFPGVNSRKVFMFHGKVRPEVAGLGGNKVANLGMRRVP